MVREQKDNNNVMELALAAEDVLAQREALVDKLVKRFNDSSERDGVLAGGMAILLAKTGKLPVEFAEEVQEKYRRIRQRILAMDEGEKTPEQIIADRKKKLEIGFPGDSLLKSAWQIERQPK